VFFSDHKEVMTINSNSRDSKNRIFFSFGLFKKHFYSFINTIFRTEPDYLLNINNDMERFNGKYCLEI